MSDVLIDADTMVDIGDAIREKLGEESLYTPSAMPPAIRSIHTGGLPGVGYTGSDLILRDADGNISGVWYIDSGGNWVEYTKSSKSSIQRIINTSSYFNNDFSTVEAEVQ